MIYSRFGKRMLDVILSSVALLVSSPVTLIAAILIRREDGGPALFRQQRVGRFQEPFELLKFRSMRVGTPNVPSRIADDSAITGIGRLLRRTNMDELPQLVNVLRGEMSLVGPRPAVPTQVNLIALRQAGSVYGVRPGLTGLAQVNSYDGMQDEDKAEFDIAYVKQLSFARDVVLILKTLDYLRKPPPKY